jgi:hypothetical protein
VKTPQRKLKATGRSGPILRGRTDPTFLIISTKPEWRKETGINKSFSYLQRDLPESYQVRLYDKAKAKIAIH